MITVCMTTYKGERFRDEQIASIQQNIAPADQFIISEDGDDIAFLDALSKDGSDKSDRNTGNDGDKIQTRNVLPLKGPGCGAVANFEYALRHAKGDIIFLSDQDDIWTENKVEKVLKAFEENPKCMLVVHDADIIDEKGDCIGESFYAFRNSDPGILKNIWKNSYIGCCMAFRKELLEYALPFPTKGTLHDQWLGILAEQMGEVVFLEDKLLHYRRHEENVSGMQHLPIMTMLYNRLSLCWNLMLRKCRGTKKYQAYTVEEIRKRWEK